MRSFIAEKFLLCIGLGQFFSSTLVLKETLSCIAAFMFVEFLLLMYIVRNF